VDEVVAVVDKEAITRSELMTEARIALALHEGEQVATADLSAEFLEEFLRYLVNQVLVAAHARRVGVSEPGGAEIDEATQGLVRRFRSPLAYQAFIRRFAIDEETVKQIMRRDLRNEAHIRERLRLRLLGVSPDEAALETKRTAVLAEWIEELRAAAEVRLLGPGGELERERR
jgi:hypothetical protein